MQPHYFDKAEADKDDWQLNMAKEQGYVRPTCLLGGAVVMQQINAGKNPCWGCNGPREKCQGSPKRD